jgi:hypothetical protein
MAFTTCIDYCEKMNRKILQLNDIMSEEIPRVVEYTVKGKYLRPSTIESLKKYIKFEEDEQVKLLYVADNNFESLNIQNNIVVGLTNIRLFKIQNNKLDFVLIKDIKNIRHEENSIFSWDKIICELKNGKIETFGIYYYESCKYFTDYINIHLLDLNIEVKFY